MNKETIAQIRIIPCSTDTFRNEELFRRFLEETLIERGGYFYFPDKMMGGDVNVLVLFQYQARIRAIGVLIEKRKVAGINEFGEKYAGYYKFDTSTIAYLATPLNREMLKSAYPYFDQFSQSLQNINIKYLEKILELLKNTNAVSIESEEEHISKIESDTIEGAEKEALVKLRVNQDVFRDRLLVKYKKCCLCGVCDPTFLVASHIKPWVESEATEKLDVSNGLLLCPNHDKLFDGGWISFDSDGKIMISSKLQEPETFFMNVNPKAKISLTEEIEKYMEYHRAHIFKR